MIDKAQKIIEEFNISSKEIDNIPNCEKISLEKKLDIIKNDLAVSRTMIGICFIFGIFLFLKGAITKDTSFLYLSLASLIPTGLWSYSFKKENKKIKEMKKNIKLQVNKEIN